jgi:hypothetical protein
MELDMNVNVRPIINSVLLILSLNVIANAQGPGPPPGFGFGPGPGFAAGFGLGLGNGKVVTNKPYSATRVTTFTQALSDGNSITRTNCSNIYRDTQGRTRQDETPNSSTCGSTPAIIIIRDPVAGVEYFINTKSNTYRQHTLKAPPSTTTTPQPNGPPGANSGQVQTTSVYCPSISANGGATLSLDGTQSIRTIPAGQIGNSQPITITSMRCYSQELQVVVSSERDDPRTGKATTQLSNITLGEPSVSFQPPSGSTLQQGPSGHARSGR